MKNYFRLFEEHDNFQYNVEYSHDDEIQPSPQEKEIVKDWSLEGVKVVSVEGTINFSDYALKISLNDGTVIDFEYHYEQGPGVPGFDADYAKIQVIENGKEKEIHDVYDEYIESEGWMSGMLVLGVLNIYEDMMGKKHGHYTGKKYGI
jgi:hypothetical protein